MKISTDVLVVGGGVSGTMAAIAAARRGVKVSLIERGGCLGGMDLWESLWIAHIKKACSGSSLKRFTVK